MIGVAGWSMPSQPNAVFAVSVPHQVLAGTVVAGWQMAKALIVAERGLVNGNDTEFMQAKIATARFYADQIHNKCTGLRDSIVVGAEAVTVMPLDAF